MSSEASNAQTNNEATTGNSSSVPIPAWCHQCQKQIRVNPNCEVYTCNDCEGDFVEIIEQPNAPDDPSVFTPPILPGLLRALSARSASTGTEETGQPSRMHTRSQAGRNSSRGNTLSNLIASRRNAQQQTEESDSSSSDEDVEDTNALPGAGAEEATSSANVANIAESGASDSSRRQEGSLRLRLRDALRNVERIRNQGDSSSNSLDSFFEDMLMMLAQARGSRVAYVGDSAGGEEGGRRHMRLGDYVIGDMDEVVNELMQQGGGPPSHSTSNEVLNKLPCVNQSIASASPHKSQNDQCAVCREEFPWSPSNDEEQAEDVAMEDNEDDSVWALPCAHWFHRECCEQWLKDHNTCPVCRNELPTTDEEYNESNNLSMQAFDRWRQAFMEGQSTRAEEAAKKVCTASAST